MEERHLGFIRRLVIAVAKPGEYWRTVTHGGGRVIGFIAILLAITTFCGFPLTCIKTSVRTNGFKDIVNDYIPEFHLSNGTLKMDEVYTKDEDDLYIKIDTKNDKYTYDDVKRYVETGSYKLVLLLGAKEGFYYNNNEYKEIKLSQLSTLTLDKAKLMNFMKTVNVIMVIGMGGVYIGTFVWYIVMALVYALLGLILKVSLQVGQEVSFRDLFLMSISAKVTMRIVLALCKLVSIHILYSNWISLVITLVYLYFGIKGMKEQRIGETQDNNYSRMA